VLGIKNQTSISRDWQKHILPYVDLPLPHPLRAQRPNQNFFITNPARDPARLIATVSPGPVVGNLTGGVGEGEDIGVVVGVGVGCAHTGKEVSYQPSKYRPCPE
jgi:hypothetical protein